MKKPSTPAKPKKPEPKKVSEETHHGLVGALPGYAAVDPQIDQETQKVIGVTETTIVAWIVEWTVKKDAFNQVIDVYPVTTSPGDEGSGIMREPDGSYKGPDGQKFASKDEVIAYFQAEEDGNKPA